MPISSPMLICARCCSLDIAGPVCPEDEDVLHCRHCGYAVPYRVMRAQIERALTDALDQIHRGVLRKTALRA